MYVDSYISAMPTCTLTTPRAARKSCNTSTILQQLVCWSFQIRAVVLIIMLVALWVRSLYWCAELTRKVHAVCLRDGSGCEGDKVCYRQDMYGGGILVDCIERALPVTVVSCTRHPRQWPRPCRALATPLHPDPAMSCLELPSARA